MPIFFELQRRKSAGLRICYLEKTVSLEKNADSLGRLIRDFQTFLERPAPNYQMTTRNDLFYTFSRILCAGVVQWQNFGFPSQ